MIISYINQFKLRKKAMFVCQGPANAGSYLILKIKKNKIILVGASLTPLKEPIAGIGEILSPIKSASYIASYSSSLLLVTAPNFLYIVSKNSLISFTPLLTFLASALVLLYKEKGNVCLLGPGKPGSYFILIKKKIKLFMNQMQELEKYFLQLNQQATQLLIHHLF